MYFLLKAVPNLLIFIFLGANLDFVPLPNTHPSTPLSNGSLHLSAITKEDEGMYKCNVSNGNGPSLIKDIVVRVIGMVLKEHTIDSHNLLFIFQKVKLNFNNF